MNEEPVNVFDADTAREIIAMKAFNLGMEPEKIEALDAVVCIMLNITDPVPLNFPDY